MESVRLLKTHAEGLKEGTVTKKQDHAIRIRELLELDEVAPQLDANSQKSQGYLGRFRGKVALQ